MKLWKMISGAGLAVAGLAAASWALRSGDVGSGRFFSDQAYHFQTLRTLTDIAADGADTSEVLETIRHIRAGDAQGWYAAWSATADQISARAASTVDRASRGRALLRAHNYYRTAAFFLPPDDPKRAGAALRDTGAFYAGLDALGVAYDRIAVPYGDGHHLAAVYYPAAQPDPTRPLLMLSGGFDSTLEELYFVLVKDAHEHGYDVLTFDGPGQGAMLREQGLVFTPEWEKPTGAVLDALLAAHAKPARIISIGMSMGGYLAPRAAAFDTRIDGVVAYDVFFDLGATGARATPPGVEWLYDRGIRWPVDLAIRIKSTFSPGFAWMAQNATWTTGASDPVAAVRALRAYTLDGVAQKITADVLILAGAEDHFVPIDQVAQFERALTSARSVTTKIYTRASGGAEHCQLGAQTLWHADLFDWLARFGNAS